MGSSRKPGPLCQVLNSPVVLDDGTLCRCESPLPGPLGEQPEMLDQFRWPLGVDTSKPLGEEAWFEQRYPDLIEDARLRFVDAINNYVCAHWGDSQYKDQKQRINVNARDTSYGNADGSIRIVKKTDNRFERCGDRPQTPHEADKVLGSFSIDIETPVTVRYSSRDYDGRNLHTFEWIAVMYVEDVLGLQEDNSVVHWLGRWTLPLAPSRRVVRARWRIRGNGQSYLVVAGDSLSKIASVICGNEQKWRTIYAANRSRIPDPNHVRPGQRLMIPIEVLESQTANKTDARDGL